MCFQSGLGSVVAVWVISIKKIIVSWKEYDKHTTLKLREIAPKTFYR